MKQTPYEKIHTSTKPGPADEDVSDREENIQRAAWRDMGGVSL